MWGRVAVYAALVLVLAAFVVTAFATPFGFVLLLLGLVALGFAVVDWLRRSGESAE